MEHIISRIIIRRVRFVLLRVGTSDSLIDTGGECRAILTGKEFEVPEVHVWTSI